MSESDHVQMYMHVHVYVCLLLQVGGNNPRGLRVPEPHFHPGGPLPNQQPWMFQPHPGHFHPHGPHPNIHPGPPGVPPLMMHPGGL